MAATAEKQELLRRLHSDLKQTHKIADYVDRRNYHSTGFGRMTLIDTPLAITAPRAPRSVGALVESTHPLKPLIEAMSTRRTLDEIRTAAGAKATEFEFEADVAPGHPRNPDPEIEAWEREVYQ